MRLWGLSAHRQTHRWGPKYIQILEAKFGVSFKRSLEIPILVRDRKYVAVNEATKQALPLMYALVLMSLSDTSIITQSPKRVSFPTDLGSPRANLELQEVSERLKLCVTSHTLAIVEGPRYMILCGPSTCNTLPRYMMLLSASTPLKAGWSRIKNVNASRGIRSLRDLTQGLVTSKVWKRLKILEPTY